MKLKTLFREGTYHRAGIVGRNGLYRMLVISSISEQTVSALTDQRAIELRDDGIVEIPAVRSIRRWAPKR